MYLQCNCKQDVSALHDHFGIYIKTEPTARSNVCRYGRWLVWIAGSNPARVMDVCCECCVLLGSDFATGRSLTQRSPNECVCFGNGRCLGETIILCT